MKYKGKNKQKTGDMSRVTKFYNNLLSASNAQIYAPLSDSKFSSPDGGETIETGWVQSTIIDLRTDKYIPTAKVTVPGYSIAVDENGQKVALPKDQQVELPIYNQGYPLLTKFKSTRINFRGLSYTRDKTTKKYTANLAAQQLANSASNLMAVLIGDMYTNLKVTNYIPTEMINSQNQSPFVAYALSLYQTGLVLCYPLALYARFITAIKKLNQLSNKNYSRLNLLLSEFNRSYVMNNVVAANNALSNVAFHKDIIPTLKAFLSVQCENNAINNTMTITDLDIKYNWGLYDADLRDFLSFKKAPSASSTSLLPSNEFYEEVEQMKEKFDIEKLIQNLFTANDSKWLDYVYNCANIWTEVCKKIALEAASYLYNIQDFNSAAKLQPNLFVDVTRIITVADIVTNEYVNTSNDYEKMFYTKHIFWDEQIKSASGSNNNSNLADLSSSVFKSTVNAIVPCFNNLQTDSFFNTNNVLYIRTDYMDDPGYAPFIDLSQYKPESSLLLLPEGEKYFDSQKIELTPGFKLLAGVSLYKISYKYSSDSSVIPIVDSSTTIGDVEVSGSTTASYEISDFHAYKCVDWAFNSYLASSFLMLNIRSERTISNKQGTNYAVAMVNFSSIAHKEHNGFRPVSYKPVSMNVIHNAPNGLGLKPIVSYVK